MPPVHTHLNPFDWSGPSAQPSVFGALPYPTPPSSSSSSRGASSSSRRASTPMNNNNNMTPFYLTALSPSVLNCTVVGPRGRVHYSVSTDSAMPGYTVVKRASERTSEWNNRMAGWKSVALIEWQKDHPRVEVRGTVAKQDTKDWLRISRDRTYRMMTIRGCQYTWAPDNQYINLWASGPIPQFLGRISRGDDTVIVELTPDALQLELLDTTVVVAVLLQCGHNID